MTKTQEIAIRSLHRIEELEDVRKLESDIWGENDSIPTHQTITAVKKRWFGSRSILRGEAYWISV